MTAMNKKYIPVLDESIIRMMKNAMKISLSKPDRLVFFLKRLLVEKRMAKRRIFYDKQGIHVPPFMIASITNRCNLHCRGCYNQAQHRDTSNELSLDRLDGLISEALQLGISYILLAGGEPLMRPEMLEVATNYKDIVFPVFTNGMLIDSKIINLLKLHKNIIPVISIEGYEKETDSRRGLGVYGHIKEVFRSLKKENIFFGTSITVTKDNFELVTGREFIKNIVHSGCSLLFFVEYIPVSEGTEYLIPDADQHDRLLMIMDMLRKDFPALFIAFPGDEERFGGCLSAGRGFVHVSPSGSLEPCPFAPYSDASVGNMTLKEALMSRFLEKIRENHAYLSENSGGCALWDKREWVKSLL